VANGSKSTRQDALWQEYPTNAENLGYTKLSVAGFDEIPFVSPTIMLEPLALDGVQQYVDMASFAGVFLPSAW
jgi:hypothetical protein